jgi:Divergent InlB B-repeat domain/Beta-propeller repeat
VGATESRMLLRKAARAVPGGPAQREPFAASRPVHTRALGVSFPGASAGAFIRGERLMTGKINHLTGRDPRQWRSGQATYGAVKVEGLFPGIDLTYYGNEQQLEYDFTIAPGADPSVIAMRFDGADSVAVNAQGELVLKFGDEEMRQPAPVIYQMAGGARRRVEGGFRLRDARTVEFAAVGYDRNAALVIDPVLGYSTYISGNLGDSALAVKVDASGSVYVAGITLSEQFVIAPTNFLQMTNAGGIIDGDAFVLKVDSTGTNLIFFTYLGGTNDDGALDMALDSSNNVYLAGFTDSSDFPVVPAGGVPGLPSGAHIAGILDTNVNRYPVDGFVAELAASGSNLIFSTFLGGGDADVVGGIALDPSNNIYVTGFTYSTNFPTTNAIVLPAPFPGTTINVLDTLVGTNMAFVTKLAPAGSGLIYSTFLGGTNFTQGEGIAADAAGYAYVTGNTASTNFPLTTNALQTDFNHATNAHFKYYGINHPPTDAFVAQIAPLGSNLVYATYLGGTNHDGGTRIAVDANTNVYVTGFSESPDFTNTVLPQVTSPGVTNLAFPNSDAFLTKFDFSGPSPTLVYSALFGGSANDTGWGVAADAAGNAFVVGSTFSTNFPVLSTNGFLSATNQGSNDVFVTSINSNGTVLIYSVLLGGHGDDLGYGIALDAQDSAYIVGQTRSTNFPTLFPLAPPATWTNGFLAKIFMTAPSNTISLLSEPTNLTLVVDGEAIVTPLITNWSFGSVHTITAPMTNTIPPPTTNSGPAGVQYVFQSWSDGGFITHPVMISGDTTFTANYNTQYLLSMSVSNSGAVSPPSGWFAPGTNVTITATPAGGDTFSGWTGSGPGSFTGTTNPVVVTMNGPITQLATFSGPTPNVLTVVINGSGSVTPDYNGQTLTPGQTYRITARPAANSLFTGWSGSLSTNSPTLTFQMQPGLVLQANFTASPFPPNQGSYVGLFYDTNNPSTTNSGYITMTLGSGGEFSGKLQMVGVTYPLSGQFSPSGFYSNGISRYRLPPLLMTFQVDFNGGNAVSGLINDGLSTAQALANRSVFSSGRQAPETGKKYTLIIPGSDNSLAAPQGASAGAVTVTASGVVQFSGTLADGTKVSQGSLVSQNGLWPLFVSLYAGHGSIFGWLSFTNLPAGPSGTVNWIKEPRPRALVYPGGFTLQSQANGSVYSGVPALNFVQGQAVLTGGNIGGNTTNTISISSGRVTGGPLLSMTLTIVPGSGLFRGTVSSPILGKIYTVNGGLLQNQNLGAGSYLGTNQSGLLLLQP